MKNKTITKALSVFLSVLMIASCFGAGLTAFAEEPFVPMPDDYLYDSGTCGENLKWELTASGVLTISPIDENQPAGEMSWESGTDPWHNNENRQCIKQVIISDGVTNIHGSAFDGCANLESVSIPESVTVIGEYAFSDCYKLSSIKLPGNLKKIGFAAFFNCYALTSISIPESTAKITGWTFANCISLETANIPKCMTTIPEQMFYYCPSLKAIEIPYGITNIEDWAFYYCSSLTSIEIPDTVTSIGNYAFYCCFSLTGTLELPNYDTLTIGTDAFHECGCRGGVDNMVQFFSNYENDFYHFSDERGTGSNEYGSWSYDEYVCNDCGSIIPNDWTYSSNSDLISSDVLIDNCDISLCSSIYNCGFSTSHTTALAEFCEIEQPATCTKNSSILIKMSDIYYEDGVKHIFAKKEIEVENTKLEHVAAEAVIENSINNVNDDDYAFESVVYCAYGCGTEISRTTIELAFVPEVAASTTADGHKAYYKDTNGNKYIYENETYKNVTDQELALHCSGVEKHEGDVYAEFKSGTAHYYFYNNTYCKNCDELLNSEKVELVQHFQQVSDEENGYDYFTDENENSWVYNNTTKKYELGEPVIFYGGKIFADTVYCVQNEKTKIVFTYTGPSPEQNFIYKPANENVTITEDGYFVSSGLNLNYANYAFVNVYSQDGNRLLGKITGYCGRLIDDLNVRDSILYLDSVNSSKYCKLQFVDENGNPSTLAKNSGYYGYSLSYEIADNSVAKSSNTLSLSSKSMNITAYTIGQTELTVKATNYQTGKVDLVKTVNLTVVAKPYGSVSVGTNETVNIKDYFKVPEGFELPIESISTDDSSIVFVNADGMVTGLKKGTTTINVNGNSITISVYNTASSFDVPDTVVYSTSEEDDYIPFIVDANADYRSGLEYEIVSKPETADVKVRTESGCCDSVLEGLDFDYDAWEKDSYCSALYLDWENDQIAGNYVVRVWPKGNKTLAKDISIKVLNSADYFGVTSEQTTLNFKYDNETHLWYAVDENDNKLSGYTTDTLSDNVYIVMASDSAYSQEELISVSSQAIDTNCHIARKSAATDNYYGYINFIGSCYGFDYDSCFGVTSEGYLVYINYYYEDERELSQDTYRQLTWAACYSESVIENNNSFLWSSDDGWFVETDKNGAPVDYSDVELEVGKDYYFSAYGSVGVCPCMNADSLTEKEKAWMLDDVGFIPEGNYIAYPDDYYPMFFINDKGHLCLAEEYEEGEYENGDSYDYPLYSCSASEQVIELENGDSFSFNLIVQTLDSNVEDYTVELSNPDVIAVSGTTVTGKSIGECTAVVTAQVQVPTSNHQDVESKYLTKTLKFNVLGVSVDDLVIVPGETLSLNALTSLDDDIVFTSSDENVATVDEEGYVTAENAGTAIITAQSDDFFDEAQVVVVDIFVEIPDEVSNVEVSEIDTNCSAPEKTYTVSYSSSDESVASVDESGNVIMNASGTATITTTITVSYGDATRVFVETKEVSFVEHSPAAPVQENVVPATCTAEGSYEEVVYCTEEGCDYEFSRTKKTIAKLDHHDDDNDGFCDGCGMVMPGKGGNIVVADGDHYRYQISTDGVNFKACGNDTFDCPDGIAYIRVTNSDYKILVNGSEPAKNENGDYVVKVDGGEIVTVVNKVVPDKEESLTLFEKIAQFFKNIINFFKNIFK